MVRLGLNDSGCLFLTSVALTQSISRRYLEPRSSDELDTWAGTQRNCERHRTLKSSGLWTHRFNEHVYSSVLGEPRFYFGQQISVFLWRGQHHRLGHRDPKLLLFAFEWQFTCIFEDKIHIGETIRQLCILLNWYFFVTIWPLSSNLEPQSTH